MDFLPLAFLMGLFGSLHCAIMCGPIVLSLPGKSDGMWKNVFQLLSYQLGRILMYTLLGLIVGWIGSSIVVFSNQKFLSLFIGSSLLIVSVFRLFSRSFHKKLSLAQAKFLHPLSRVLPKIFKLPFWGFLFGMLNGLIPCGMVYLSLATALNTGSVSAGATFMFLFGLGTSPLMMTISLGGFYLRKYIPFNVQKLIPWFTLFIGLLFILRASDLGIPFLSPISGSGYAHGAECR
ncbi:sulfite exporter TauE/SafE family protein [Pedobacter sp. AW1-32]|uniref:sulfite exporter TauE/SafE family protein n=1 Tax=Pedobacter sp. AW1-32 TaxID=3383026 RepID=UPI003FEF9472